MTTTKNPYIIAVSGKGGVGKTTISALLVDELIRSGRSGPILAVDADPATTLHLSLGLPEPRTTIADIRDTVKLDAKTMRSLPQGETAADYVQRRVREAGVLQRYQLRGSDLDFLAMGRGEGQHCFCNINAKLKVVLNDLVKNYSLVVIDNEAGLEHLNRYRVPKVDLFLLVKTPGRASTEVVERILNAAASAKMEIGQTGYIFNRAWTEGQRAMKKLNNGDLSVTLPRSNAVERAEIHSDPIIALDDDNSFRAGVRELAEIILQG